MSEFIIVCKPNKDKNKNKFYLIQANNIEDITLVGNVAISGSIRNISNEFDEIYKIYSNLNY